MRTGEGAPRTHLEAMFGRHTRRRRWLTLLAAAAAVLAVMLPAAAGWRWARAARVETGRAGRRVLVLTDGGADAG